MSCTGYVPATRCASRDSSASRHRSQAGDTLVEVLVAVIVVGLCGVALLLAFSTSITSTSAYRNLAAMDTVLRSASEAAVSQIQQQTPPLFSSCATPSYYQSQVALGAANATFTTVQYWTGTSFSPSCPAGSLSPQLLTIVVTGPQGVSDTNSFVVTYPNYSKSALADLPFAFREI